MELCCSSPMVPGATLTEKADRLRQWGYTAISVFQSLNEWNDDVHAELLDLQDATGVRPVEFVLIDAVYGNAMAAEEPLRERCRQMYREAARTCVEISAVTEIEYQYGQQDPMPLFDPYQQLDPSQRTAFIDFYREMLALVEGSAAAVLLEPLNRYESRYLNRCQDNLDILREINHPNAGLLPDVFHMSIEESDIPGALRLAGTEVRQVHLGDSNRLLPGRGSLDWAPIFAALREIEYAGAVNLECSTSGRPEITLPQTAAFLRQLIDS